MRLVPSTRTIPSLDPMSNQSAHAEVLIANEYVMVLVEPSASDALPVTPTVASSAAFSATVLSALFESDTAPTSNSSWSVIEIVIVAESASEPSALAALITTSQEVADS